MAEYKNTLTLQVVDESGAVVSSVIVDLRNAIVGSTAPTTATAARIGMQYYVVTDTVITAEYVCVAEADGVYTWVEREVPGGSVSVDDTLSVSGAAADAAVVGQRLTEQSEAIANLQTSGLTTGQITALDGMFKIAAYTEDAADAYEAFKLAFGVGGAVAVPATSIVLSASELSFEDAESQTLTATVEPSDTTDKVVWTSSEPTVASVTNGVVKPLSNGTAVITATAGSVSATCAVTVDIAEEEQITLTSISASYSGGDVDVGTALTDLTGIVVTATYSDGSTAAVTGYTLSGEIAEGVNIITVSYGGLTATFTVTGVAEVVEYSVANNLTNVTNSNDQTTVTDGYYSATLAVNDGYALESVIVTMGGVDVTADVYTAETGGILITEVTGNIVITAMATVLEVIPMAKFSSKYIYIYAEDGTTNLTAAYQNGYTSYNATETDANAIVELTNVGESTQTYTVYIGNVSDNKFAAMKKSVAISAGESVRYIYTVKAGCKLQVATPNDDTTITAKAYGVLDVYQPTAEYDVTVKYYDTIKTYSDGTTDNLLKNAYYNRVVYTKETFAEDTDLIISIVNNGENVITFSGTDSYFGCTNPENANTVYYGVQKFWANANVKAGQVLKYTYTVKAGYAFAISNVNENFTADIVYVEKA